MMAGNSLNGNLTLPSTRYCVHLLGNTTATGQSQKMETQLQVRWGWMAFPAPPVALAAVFLGITPFQTRRTRSDAWKLSPMPLVYLDLDQPAQARTLRSRRPDSCGERGWGCEHEIPEAWH
ncbi:hypothetical protein BDV28DRAFT_129155 [Aspergillus coremiiformis]|uniref:Uncharacterized protein n=1 Tax=Aspergillus coremiiformis TaxID=138285 RepID=A0A5N6ZCL1_9EURO|nr:hypothetical protein BDV28DRAFT_129155 [Aspergillus coremiiformis]